MNTTLAKIEAYKNAVQPTVSAGNSDATAKLAGLKSLLDRGAITQEEYDTKKKQLLDQM